MNIRTEQLEAYGNFVRARKRDERTRLAATSTSDVDLSARDVDLGTTG